MRLQQCIFNYFVQGKQEKKIHFCLVASCLLIIATIFHKYMYFEKFHKYHRYSLVLHIICVLLLSLGPSLILLPRRSYSPASSSTDLLRFLKKKNACIVAAQLPTVQQLGNRVHDCKKMAIFLQLSSTIS